MLVLFFPCVEFVSSERGSNKKQATAVCALSMVRQLYANSLIEKQGDPIKHVSRGSLIEGKGAIIPKAKLALDEQNRKRKAEDQVSTFCTSSYTGFLKED